MGIVRMNVELLKVKDNRYTLRRNFEEKLLCLPPSTFQGPLIEGGGIN